MTPEQRKHFEFVRDEMHGEPIKDKPCCVGGVAHDCHVGQNCKAMKKLKLIVDAAKNDDMHRVIELAEKQQDKFCDNNCVWTDHHKDCVRAEQEPVAIHQFRNPNCSDWYDGIPEHHDGHGPYEVRTLYTHPQSKAGETK